MPSRTFHPAPTQCKPTFTLLVLLLLLLSPGCKITPPQKGPDARVHNPQDITANAEQIRLRMRGLVQPMTGSIVTAADHILATTTDPAVRREALLWKIDAVPALRQALFQPSPITGVADAWALTFQMADYFDTGPGARALGDAHTLAVKTSQDLEAEMAQVAASLTASGNVSGARQYIRKWALEHPITGSIASRESVLSHVATSDLSVSLSATEAAGSLVTSVDDLNRRLEIYSAQLLDQARWQAELFSMDLSRQYALDKAIPLAEQTMQSANRAADSLERTLPAIERSLAIVERTPALITAQREATTQALAAEMARATTFAQQERIAALKQLATERLATEQEMNEILAHQRQTLTTDVEGIATRAVDHAFVRAAELSAALLLVLLIVLLFSLLLTRRLLFRAQTPAPKTQPPL